MGYTAPEVVTGVSEGYSFPADLWSFGIVMVELFTGSLPFEDKNDPMEIHKQIVQADIKYQRELVDPSARDLLQ